MAYALNRLRFGNLFEGVVVRYRRLVYVLVGCVWFVLVCCCCAWVCGFVVVCCLSLVRGVVFVCVGEVLVSPYSSVVEHPLSKRKVGSSILLGGIPFCSTHS